MPFRWSPQIAMALILCAALGVRVGAATWWQSRLPPGERFRFGDSKSYWELARSLARDGRFQQQNEDERILRTPGYPLLLSSLFLVVGRDREPPVIAARFVGCLLGTLTVGLVVWLAWLCFDLRTALWAGVLAAADPGAIAISILVLSEASFAPCLLLQLVLWVSAVKCERRRASLGLATLGGGAAGLTTLMRPSWLLFTPLAVAASMAFAARRGRQLGIGAALMFGLIATMTPWWIRNYRVTGRFVPTTLQLGASLYDGWRPDADGASDIMQFAPRFYSELKREDKQRLEPPEDVFEYRLDRRMRDAAIEWARTHPTRVVQLMGIKFLRMWNIWPNDSELNSPLVRLMVAIGYVPILVLGLVGVYRVGVRRWDAALCFLPAVYMTCLHMVFVGSIRYRQPVMIPVIVLAAAMMARWFGRSDSTADRRVIRQGHSSRGA